MSDRTKSRESSRRFNQLFDEKLSRAQWDFLQRLALADRQQLAVDGKTLNMCQRLEDKRLVKVSAVGLPRKIGGFVQITDQGSALVLRELQQKESQP